MLSERHDSSAAPGTQSDRPLDPSVDLRAGTVQARDARIQRILHLLADSQSSESEKSRVKLLAIRILAMDDIGDTFLTAIELACGRSLNPIAPILAVDFLNDSPVDTRKVSAHQLLSLGLICADREYRSNDKLKQIMRPQLTTQLTQGHAGAALQANWEIAKCFKESLTTDLSPSMFHELMLVGPEISELEPSPAEVAWLLNRIRQLVAVRMPGDAAIQLTAMIEGFALAKEIGDAKSAKKCADFLKNDFGPPETQASFEATVRMRALMPLLTRHDIEEEVTQGFRDLMLTTNEDPEHPGFGDMIDRTKIVGKFVHEIAHCTPAEVEFMLELAAAAFKKDQAGRNEVVLVKLAKFAPELSKLTETKRENVSDMLRILYGRFASSVGYIDRFTSLIVKALEQGGRPDLIKLLEQVLTIHSEFNPAELFTLGASLEPFFDPRSPPDLIRTYLSAMEDSRFRKRAVSLELLHRLGLHSAVYVLPEARTTEQLALALRPIGRLLRKNHRLFLQEEPDAEEYARLQEAFYPQVRRVYQDDQQQGRRRAGNEPSVPFQLLVPPVQRSLGGFNRVADEHHGFGVRAIPARRTPDGEAPLLIRFGCRFGRVVMLNTQDNRKFPGKGFAIADLEPERLFIGRDPQVSNDPFKLYKDAWPTFGPAIERLRHAQFVFTRGMIAISCKDEDYYSLTIEGRKIQYSLVIFNAHFENPFNEVAQLVPTAALRDYFKGTLSGLDNFRGFDPRKPDAAAKMPDQKTFAKHPVFGRYVINVGLARKALLGIDPAGSGEHNAWLMYRSDAHLHDVHLRAVDRSFAVANRGGWGSSDSAAARALIDHIDAHPLHDDSSGDSREVLMGSVSHEKRSELALLGTGEHQLIAKRKALIARLENLDLVKDSFERDVWQCVNRLMDLDDVFRIACAYDGRGMTNPRDSLSQDQEPIEFGDPDLAGFNSGSEQMLRELYRFNASLDFSAIDRARVPVLVSGDALYSARYDNPKVMIDAYDMTGFVGNKRIAFSQTSMTEDDVMVWQSGVLPLIQDSPGRIAALWIVERGMLPDILLEKLDKMRGEKL